MRADLIVAGDEAPRGRHITAGESAGSNKQKRQGLAISPSLVESSETAGRRGTGNLSFALILGA